jgi:hypothetical protein
MKVDGGESVRNKRKGTMMNEKVFDNQQHVLQKQQHFI